MSYTWTVTDPDSYREKLWKFLNDRLLRFNPYTVSDEELLAGVVKIRWRGPFSLTQMVIMNFLDIQRSEDGNFMNDKVFYTLGDSDDVITEYMTAFTSKRIANDQLREIRSTINGRPITQSKQIYPLVGKRLFVSRNIITLTRSGSYSKAMRMHRLKNDTAIDAAIIREASISAKLEMLERLLNYPHAYTYLHGTPTEPVDIETPIRALMAQIAEFPNVSVPGYGRSKIEFPC